MTIREEIESHPALLKLLSELIGQICPVRVEYVVSTTLWMEQPRLRWSHDNELRGDYLTEQDYPVSRRYSTKP